jgi:hypothetical protein
MSIFPAGHLNSHKDDPDDAIDTPLLRKPMVSQHFSVSRVSSGVDFNKFYTSKFDPFLANDFWKMMHKFYKIIIEKISHWIIGEIKQ